MFKQLNVIIFNSIGLRKKGIASFPIISPSPVSGRKVLLLNIASGSLLQYDFQNIDTAFVIKFEKPASRDEYTELCV